MIYLDHNATTPVEPVVREAMLRALGEDFGNPSSHHLVGARAAAMVDEARGHVARLIGARDSEIVFTSGGTEADNAAVRGVLAARPNKRHLVVSAIEHHAILDLAAELERGGVRVTRLGVSGAGVVHLGELESCIMDDTALVSIMHSNNETGVIQPIGEAVKICRRKGVLMHTDAVQSVGKVELNVSELGVDLLSLSAHKIRGPKGCGALFIRRGTAFRPSLIGGHQERDRRGGTHNVPGIVGLGAACARLRTLTPEHVEHVRRLRDRLERELTVRLRGVHVIGRDAERLPNTLCVCFEGVESEALLVLLSQAGICASGGAACSSGSLEPSHVLKAMGVAPVIAQGQVRFSFGDENTEADIERLMEVLPEIVAKVGSLNRAEEAVAAIR